MLQIDPKKFKHIQNKKIPSPLRPKFRNRAESNIYFFSDGKNQKDTKTAIIKGFKIIGSLTLIVIGSYLLIT